MLAMNVNVSVNQAYEFDVNIKLECRTSVLMFGMYSATYCGLVDVTRHTV